MKKVLLVVFGPTDGTEMLRLAIRLKKSREYVPVIYFFADFETLRDRLDYSYLNDIECRNINGIINSTLPTKTPASLDGDHVTSSRQSLLRRMIANLPNWLKVLLYAIVFKGPRKIYNIRSVIYRVRLKFYQTSLPGIVFSEKIAIKKISKLMDDVRPDALIMPLETVGHYSATFTKAASDKGIPSAIVPYTVPVNIPEICERWYYDSSYWVSSPIKQIIKRLFPNWIYNYRDRELFRLLPSQMIALNGLGMLPDEPWKAGGLKFSQAIAVENEVMKKFYLKEGFSEINLCVTGALVDDILAENKKTAGVSRERLYDSLGFDNDHPMILTALPPDFTEREVCEFDSYADLVEFWTTSLSDLPGFNIVVRLHPSLSYNDMKHIEKYGVRISQDDTAELMPLCKIFVCSVSATIRWAITCGIPVINYDVYKFRYQDYDDAGGMVKIEERKGYLTELKKITADKTYYAELASRQENCMHQWGNLDGKTMDRIDEMISNLLAEKRTTNNPLL